MAVITVYNSKGGVGKTTVSLAVASAAAARGISTAIIDADPNPPHALWTGLGEDASHGETVVRDGIGVTICRDIDRIGRQIHEVGQEFDLVLVDLEGSRATAAGTAIARSHGVVIPFQPNDLDAKEAMESAGLVEAIGAEIGAKILYRLLFTRTPYIRRSRHNDMIGEIQEAGVALLSFRGSWLEMPERAAFAQMFHYGVRLDRVAAAVQADLDEKIEKMDAGSGLPSNEKRAAQQKLRDQRQSIEGQVAACMENATALLNGVIELYEEAVAAEETTTTN